MVSGHVSPCSPWVKNARTMRERSEYDHLTSENARDRRQEYDDGIFPSSKINKTRETFLADSTLWLSRGRLVQDRATRNPKLNCRNWECGVVVPSIVAAVDELRETPLHKDDNDDNDNEAVTAAAVALPFDPNVPIPMLYPAPGLEEQQQRPWFFSNLDRH